MKSLFIVLLLVPLTFAHAQFSIKGEIELRPNVALSSFKDNWSTQVGVTLRGHVEASYDLSPAGFHVVLDPTVVLSGSSIEQALLEPGLTEAYAQYRFENADVSAGLERLPIEYARLSVPYRLEPVSKSGQPLGLLGLRASFFLDDWRFRPNVLYRTQDKQLGAVLSVRKNFAEFELEAHGSYLANELAVGLGGSGLAGDLIIYGEGWTLYDLQNNHWDARAALGLNGFWEDRLWTLEAAYATNPVIVSTSAFPQLSAQLSLPYDDGLSLDINSSLAYANKLFVPSEKDIYSATRISLSQAEPDYTLSTGLNLLYSSSSLAIGWDLSLIQFY